MTSIDDLFKASGVGNKRKLEPLRDPDQVYKSARLTPDSDGRRHAHAQDGNNLDDTEAGPAPPDDEDGNYGPSLPPQDDEDDDEDGRFFGGGITQQQSEVLDHLGGDNDDAQLEKIDKAWLHKTASTFKTRIAENTRLRAEYASEPEKFIDSEARLDTDIKALSILAEYPSLYPEFVGLGCIDSLAELLTHENTDIVIDTVEIINELTDEDVTAEDEQWSALVNAFLKAGLLGLLVSNLERLDEKEEVDRNGVYYALNVVENLCSRLAIAEQVGGQDNLLKWLLRRIQVKESPVGQNKQYAAEVLAILVQTSPKNRRKLVNLEAVDTMLQLIAPYRKMDPDKGGEEEEYMENLFETLTCLVDEPEGKAKFVEAEGIELCLIMLKEGKMSKLASLRLLDHAVGGSGSGAEMCQKLVDAGGLKSIFTLFMKRTNESQTAEHLIGIFASMLRLLPGDSPHRIRTLAKFVEKQYEKIEKLVRLRREYAARIGAVDESIRHEQASLTADERADMAGGWFSRRLDAGLFCLQSLDVILAWLVAEDVGAQRTIIRLLADRDESLANVRATIQEQLDDMSDEDAESAESREMLTTLARFLQ